MLLLVSPSSADNAFELIVNEKHAGFGSNFNAAAQFDITKLVKPGKMTNRQFHDAILQGGRMPVEMVRARLLKQALPRDHAPRWRFYGDPLGRAVSDR